MKFNADTAVELLEIARISIVIASICSDDCPITLVKRDTLPRGGSGRLVSFAVDDVITYRAK